MHDILIEEKILSENDSIASANRDQLKALGIFSVNVVSSPGAGKTTLIEKLVPALNGFAGRLAVIEGDQETTLDADRIAKLGVPVRQVTTGRACHLDAHMISHALDWLKGFSGVRLLIIENVGNMVCPAEYDLGEDLMITVMSTAEGDDKPLKYPAIFANSDCLVINKADLIPYTDFDMARARENALKVNPYLKIFETSARTGFGVKEFSEWLTGKVNGKEGKI